MSKFKHIVLVCIGILFFVSAYGQDTNRVLKPVPVLAQSDSVLRIAVIQSSIPYFKLSSKKLDELGATDVGEALKVVPGIQIKDYGGIGGLKTVSFRSLGAAHTSVLVDGNLIPNLQSGSINLSSFELFGLDGIAFSSGQTVDDRSTASAYTQANTIALSSFLANRPDTLRFGLYTNSTTINAFEKGGYFQHRLGNNFFLGGQGLVKFGSGVYPFNYPESLGGQEGTRENAELFNYRFRLVGGYQNKQSTFLASYYHNDNEQELPGAAVLYNPSNDQKLWNEDQRLSFNHALKKGRWVFHEHLTLQENKMRYYDPYYPNLDGFIDARYTQNTLTGGGMIKRRLRFANEVIFIGIDGIRGTLMGRNLRTRPTRSSGVGVLGGSTLLGRFKLEGNLSVQVVKDTYETIELQGTRKFVKFSPFLSVAYIPFDKIGLRLRGFYKRTFRMPTFNDLYYNFVGNTLLEPEEANLFNVGVTLGHVWKKWTVEFTADAYYNQVWNKIVAIPTKDLFNWSMQNIGRTEIKGVDLGGLIEWRKKSWRFDLNGNYAFNESIDITDPTGISYGHQIPYTPYNTITGGLGVEWNGFRISSNVLRSGFRFSLNENIYANYLPAFTDLNIGVSKQMRFAKSDVLVDLKCMNLFDKNYQVVRSFPMPGRYFQLRLKYNFRK